MSQKVILHDPNRSLNIVVSTFDGDDSLHKEKDADLYCVGTPSWLIKHIVWALLNGKRVEITHKDDATAR